jgi:small GTP-binding protein
MSKEITIKTIIIGDTYGGKTSILNRYINKNFSTLFMATIGVDFYKSLIIKNNNKYKFTIWDTSGQEKFNSIISSYYRDVGVIIIVFDLTNYNSFLNLRNWIETISVYESNDIVKVIVGNKCDLEKEKKVNFNEAIDFCKKNNAIYIETSAKENINIDNIFSNVVEIIDVKVMNNEPLNKNIKVINNFDIIDELRNNQNNQMNNKSKKKTPSCCVIM